MPGQGRLGDKANIPADSHGCPACPHPGVGPAIVGSTDVMVNSRPAVRVDDTGLHAACCNTNTWTATQGSASVFINNKAAHRLGDKTKHCGGNGNLIEGSSNVIVGGGSTSGAAGGSGGGSSSGSSGGGSGSGTASADGINSNQTGTGGGGSAIPIAAQGVAIPPAANAPPAPPPSTSTDNKWFELVLLDEVGDPIANVDLKFTYNGKTAVVPTGGDGVARVEDPAATSAQVVVVSQSKLRAALKPRWSKGRAPKPPSGFGVTVQPLDAHLESVALKAAARSTLVITPFFTCREVPGAQFAFARSFPKQDALSSLAAIVEDLNAKDADGTPRDRKALIFGHTDRSGSDELNKELSERRAKAIYALFTHDDARWEELFTGTPATKHWHETWGTRETQHMLNALSIPDDTGDSLAEDGVLGARTKQAIHRFQKSHSLNISDQLGKAGRKKLFVEYAKRVTPTPIAKDRFVSANGTPYVGCGEYNPLSMSAKDAESRRAIVMVFDGAAGPATPLPCTSNSVAPCREECSPPGSPAIDPKKPYRCRVYKEIATKCACQGGADLSHDVFVRLLLPAERAKQLPHKFVLEGDDGSKRVLDVASATAASDGNAELHFEHVPPTMSYALRATSCTPAHTIIELTAFDQLSAEPVLDEVREQTQRWLDRGAR